MRHFSSYGPVNTKLYYYVPRTALLERALLQLVGENPAEGGHYITVWAPRQRGKTWVMQQVVLTLRHDKQYENFDVVVRGLEHLKREKNVDSIVEAIAQEIIEDLELECEPITTLKTFDSVFKKGVLKKPLILILDEFDALPEDAISGIAGVFRNIYNSRQYQADNPCA